jgi:activator of HSP90 ATPase
MIKTSYRAFQQINYIVLELIRQFYDEIRSFRITGENGADQYVQFDNRYIREQVLVDPMTGAQDYRRPVFDIKITSQKQSPFNKIAQNELAKELYQLGAFNPQMADQSLMMLEMMDFEQKDVVIQKVQQNGTLMQMVQNLSAVAIKLAAIVDQQNGTNTVAEVSQVLGVQTAGAQPVPAGGGVEGSAMTETDSNESTTMSKARLAAQKRSQVK